ncbi:hypothetical protein EDB83DRAFT_2323720 [Lactarius deliciosus]|nr:hypothetical protein EDB83DRAFT_2323720 [Lactarius deliciosus]
MCSTQKAMMHSVAKVRSGTSVQTRTPEPNGKVRFQFRFWFNTAASGPVPRSAALEACKRDIAFLFQCHSRASTLALTQPSSSEMIDLICFKYNANSTHAPPQQASMVSCTLSCAPGYEDRTCGRYTSFRNNIRWNADLEQFHLMPFATTSSQYMTHSNYLQLSTTLNLVHELWAERESGLKGKEPAQLVGNHHAIKPTAKAQQASLTGFFSSRTVLVNSKEFANLGNSSPTKQGNSTPTAPRGNVKRPKASAGPNKHIKSTMDNQDVESKTNDDRDFTISNGEEAGGSDGGDNTEEEGGYEQMRQDADQDRRVFFKVKHDVDGQEKDGHMCDICKKLGVSEKDAFFTSKSVSTLHTHIARAKDTHREVYLKRCKDAGVDPHLRAIGSDDNDKNVTLTQVNLDGFMQRIPTWSKKGLMEHVIQFIVEDDHSANIGEALLCIAEHYGILNKIGWMTSDNASSNNKAGHYMQRRLHNLLDNCGSLVSIAFDGDVGEATGGDEDWTADWEELDNMLDNEEVDGTVTFQPGDLLGKAIALITQIQRSPQASSYFQTVCAEEGVKPLELKKWARTHWGSMYDLLEQLLSSKLAVNKFILVADDLDRVPKLKNKSYFNYRITPDEWKLLELMREVLQEP